MSETENTEPTAACAPAGKPEIIHKPMWAQLVSDIFSPLVVPTFAMVVALWCTDMRTLPADNRLTDGDAGGGADHRCDPVRGDNAAAPDRACERHGDQQPQPAAAADGRRGGVLLRRVASDARVRGSGVALRLLFRRDGGYSARHGDHGSMENQRPRYGGGRLPGHDGLVCGIRSGRHQRDGCADAL